MAAPIAKIAIQIAASFAAFGNGSRRASKALAGRISISAIIAALAA
ncbi:hypothetical protein PQ455_07215 [Sphingomonas naphthae]|uniref:Uncharacterized protein n=1 Tax=Sphingomonas naphthae TaxID=1813468 RepID=A0ABY7TPY3_9SPHN|nr:hypothetical protein [Sphingomonas naphthae]WCT75000.1 hypothetical protein PQ455_07215 [Sphingomonas naphthae]